MKRFKDFEEEMTSTASVAGAGDNPEKIVPVHLKKKKKKKPEVIDRLDELSMRKKWAAGRERALRGPSKKKKPLWARTMGKDAKKNIERAKKRKEYEMGKRYTQAKPKLGSLGS